MSFSWELRQQGARELCSGDWDLAAKSSSEALVKEKKAQLLLCGSNENIARIKLMKQVAFHFEVNFVTLKKGTFD